MSGQSKNRLQSHLSRFLIATLLVNLFSGTFFGLFTKPLIAQAQGSEVPQPIITTPPGVTPNIPLIRGQVIPSAQDRILFCNPDLSCPDEAEIIIDNTTGGQVLNFQIPLSDLMTLEDGRNDFAFIAEKVGVGYSEPLGFTVYISLSSESVTADIVPPELETCINEVVPAGEDSSYDTENYGFTNPNPSGYYLDQSSVAYDSLPDDGLSYSAYRTYGSDTDTSGE